MNNYGNPMGGVGTPFGQDPAVYQVLRVRYFPTVQQPGLYMRPYTIAPDGNSLNALSEAILQSGSMNVTAHTVAPIVNDILVPSQVPFATAFTDSFLAEARYIFLIEVLATHNSVTTKTYIQGFTNYADPTFSGKLDPNMMHEVTSVIETVIQNTPTPYGIIEREILSKYYDVIKGLQNEVIHVQTPRNIQSNIEMLSHQDVSGSIADYYLGNNVSYVNPITQIDRTSDSVKVSSVENSMAARFMAENLNQGIRSLKEKEMQMNSGDGFKADLRPTLVSTDPNINSNRVLNALNRAQGFNTPKASFSLASLDALNPGCVGTLAEIITPRRGGIDDPYAHTPDMEEHWNGQDSTTSVAHAMIEEAVALALRTGLHEVYFVVDNTTTSHMSIDLTGMILNAQSFVNVVDQDKQVLVESFKNAYYHEVFFPHTRMGAIPVKAEIIVNILGISKIKLYYAGYQTGWYTLPTIFNTNATRVLTPDGNSFNETSRMMNLLIGQVSNTSSSYLKPNPNLI